jgi:predicted HicB family RNase H-like nuclease
MIKQYPMRVEELIWRKAKSKAALEDISLREVVERLLIAWINGKINIDKKETMK